MPKDPHDYQKYRHYYLARESSAQGIKKREIRAKDRAAAVASGRLTGPHDPREVDHIKSLAKGGSGAVSNTQIISEKANRKKYDH